MAMISALWTRRSTRATTQEVLGKASPHSENGRLVVMMPAGHDQGRLTAASEDELAGATGPAQCGARQQEIYRALGIDPAPGGIRKMIV